MIGCDPNVLLLTKQLWNSTHPPTLHIGRLTWPWYFSMKLHGHESLPAKQHHWVCFLSPCNWLRYVRCWLFAQLPTHCTWSTSSLFGDTWLQYSLFPSIHDYWSVYTYIFIFTYNIQGGFQYFFLFTPMWGRFPIWEIFFKGVETTK